MGWTRSAYSATALSSIVGTRASTLSCRSRPSGLVDALKFIGSAPPRQSGLAPGVGLGLGLGLGLGFGFGFGLGLGLGPNPGVGRDGRGAQRGIHGAGGC